MARTRPQFGGFVRGMGILLVVLTIFGLAAVVVYLLSDINHRHFRISQSGDVLTVEQGRFFPIGFGAYDAESDALAQAYRPLELPSQQNIGQSRVFDDRNGLDRALFTLLSGWARQGLEDSEPAALALASTYVRRAEMLPGIAEQQRQQLRGLRADASYRQAESIVTGIAQQLRRAEAAYQLALDLGTAHAAQARVGLLAARDKLRLLGDTHAPPPQHPSEVPIAAPPL